MVSAVHNQDHIEWAYVLKYINPGKSFYYWSCEIPTNPILFTFSNHHTIWRSSTVALQCYK